MSNIRQEITDLIVQAIEAGIPPWRAGWSRQQAPHANAHTGKAYKGINQLILSMAPHTDPRWLTFKQSSSMGFKVKKGERGTRIVKMVEVARQMAGPLPDSEMLVADDKTALVMKAYTVFNAEQLDGVPPMPDAPSNFEPVPAVDAMAQGLVQTTGLNIVEGGSQPCYVPALDTVRMPRAHLFYSNEDRVCTYLHELVHATGHPKRMDRPQCFARFGSELYAKEELRAELGSAMLCGQIGLAIGQSQIDSHAAYVSSWLDALRRDKSEIFKAAADAQRICDYLGQWLPEPVPSPAPVAPDHGLCGGISAERVSTRRAPARKL